MADKKCEYCGKMFVCKPSHIVKRRNCSRECYGKSQELDLPPLSSRQLQVIVGCLLGDGSISRQKKSRNSDNLVGNSCFQETHSVTCREYCDGLAAELGEWFSSFYEYYPQDGVHYPTCQVRSKAHRFFTWLRWKWYPDDVKIIPPDVELTTLTVAHWYCGDGTYDKNKNICSIATCCFSVDDVGLLVDKLRSCLNVRANVCFHGKYPCINISSYSQQRFFDLIRPHITWNCFKYKIPLGQIQRRVNNIYWIFKAPDGSIHETQCLSELCNKYGLHIAHMCSVANGRRRHHRGWEKVVVCASNE